MKSFKRAIFVFCEIASLLICTNGCNNKTINPYVFSNPVPVDSDKISNGNLRTPDIAIEPGSISPEILHPGNSVLCKFTLTASSDLQSPASIVCYIKNNTKTLYSNFASRSKITDTESNQYECNLMLPKTKGNYSLQFEMIYTTKKQSQSDIQQPFKIMSPPQRLNVK